MNWVPSRNLYDALADSCGTYLVSADRTQPNVTLKNPRLTQRQFDSLKAFLQANKGRLEQLGRQS